MKVLCAMILVGVLTLPAVAHNGVSATFNESKATTLHGVVTVVNWANPHVTLTMEVKEANGAVITWQIEIAAPNALFRDGIKKDSISVMKTCNVLIWPARDGTHSGAGRTVTFEDGKTLDLHDRFGDIPIAKPALAPLR